jgi:hypothetical protein
MTITVPADDRDRHSVLTIRIPMRLQRRGGRKLIMMPEGVPVPARKPRRDETLVKALVRAHRWRRRIESGRAKSITDLAEQEGVKLAFVCRLLPLTCLAPDIVEAILDGRQPKELRLGQMLGNGPLGWEGQRSAWGSCGPAQAMSLSLNVLARRAEPAGSGLEAFRADPAGVKSKFVLVVGSNLCSNSLSINAACILLSKMSSARRRAT